MTIELKHNTYLTSAKTKFGHSISVYDDSIGPLWICGEEFGPSWIIRAQSFEDAWEIWTDEQPAIADEDVHEAYQWEVPGTSDRWGRPETANLIDYKWVENASGRGGRGIRPFTQQARIDCFNATGKVFHAGEEMELELAEGYEYKANFGSTSGIVNKGHNSWLNELTPEYLKETGIRITVSADPLD